MGFKSNKINKKLPPWLKFPIYLLEYAYSELSAIPKTIITELAIRAPSFFQKRQKKAKILAYWDFNHRLAKLGDFTVFLQMLNMLRIQWSMENKNNIDLCFIDDKNHPNSKQKRYNKSFEFKRAIKALSITNPHIDTVYHFKSNKEFYEFLAKNKEKYQRWPPTIEGSYPLDCRKIETIYNETRKLPLLSIPKEILMSIYDLYEKKLDGSLPIVIHVRKNKDHTIKRNTDFKELEKFLKHYQNDSRFKFVIICNKDEFPISWKNYQNVLYSKDYFEGIEYDLGFVKSSFLSIFARSGMMIFSWYSNVPHILTGKYDHFKHSANPPNRTFTFNQKTQRDMRKSPSAKELITEFENFVTDLNNEERNNFEEVKNSLK